MTSHVLLKPTTMELKEYTCYRVFTRGKNTYRVYKKLGGQSGGRASAQRGTTFESLWYTRYRQNHHSTYKCGACSGWLQLQNTQLELFGEHDFIPSDREYVLDPFIRVASRHASSECNER